MMGRWEKDMAPHNYFCTVASFTSLIEWVSKTSGEIIITSVLDVVFG